MSRILEEEKKTAKAENNLVLLEKHHREMAKLVLHSFVQKSVHINLQFGPANPNSYKPNTTKPSYITKNRAYYVPDTAQCRS
jgi:hypothetical protein